ncbi:MAG: hypothetical protein E7474_12470, partial [Ruminococcaceae bacterium]|nr:hypothetical protein [Oscillospiraceae bacterium]
MKTPTGKKVVSLLLSLVMAITLLPQPAWAAVAHDAPEWGRAISDAAEAVAAHARLVFGANGPYAGASTDGAYGVGHVWLCRTSDRQVVTQLFRSAYSYNGNSYDEVSNTTADASYDKASNTLTLNNFSGSGKNLVIEQMGEDFKIALSGSSVIDYMLVNGYGYGGSVTFTGDGSLTVNGVGQNGYLRYYGISMDGGGGPAVLAVENTVSLTVSAAEDSAAINVGNTTSNPGLVINGACNGTAGHQIVHKASVPWKNSEGTQSVLIYRDTREESERFSYSGVTYEFYGLSGTSKGNGTRASDQQTLDYITFELWLLERDEEHDWYYCVQNYGSVYVWADDPVYQAHQDNTDEITLEMAKDYFVRINTDTYSEDWTVIDAQSETLSSVLITPSAQAANAPEITKTMLNPAYLGRAYSDTLTATPHTAGKAITWSLSSGALPDGLTLAESGLLSGTPTKSGNFSFRVQASEADNDTPAYYQYTLSVAAPTITTASTLHGLEGAAFRPITLEAAAANGGAITWSSEDLPASLSLNASTGVISRAADAGDGAPAQGSLSFTVTASETGGGIASKTFTLNIVESRTVSYALGGGTPADGVSYEPVSVASGEVIALPAAPTRTADDGKGDYSFAGWKVTSTGQAKGYFYNAGNAFTVTENVTFTAQWERPLTVSYNGQIVGCVSLCGVRSDTSEETLWSDYGSTVKSFSAVTVDSWNILGRTFTALKLYARVDGRNVAIASYTGTVNQETGPITLTPAGDFAVLSGVTVTGLSEDTDYTIQHVIHTVSAQECYIYDFPCLVTDDGAADAYTVKLYGVMGSEHYGSYNWGDSYLATLSGGRLTVTPSQLQSSAVITGTTTVNSNEVSGVTVTATQNIGGVWRTARATSTYESGAARYSLNLVPGFPATLTAEYHGQQLSITGDRDALDVASNATSVTHDLSAISNQLTLTITPNIAGMNDAEKALAGKYLANNIGCVNGWLWNSGRGVVTFGSGAWQNRTESFTMQSADAQKMLYSISFISGTSGTLSVRADVPGLTAMEDSSVALSNSVASAAFTPSLIPGVILNASTKRYSAELFTAWYDESGDYVGKSDSFKVNSAVRCCGIPCPTGNAGTYKVVLLSAGYDGMVDNKAYSELPAGAELKSWDVTLASGKVVDLGSFVASEAQSENAAFVTKPGSTMTASAESFSSTSELIAFTGRIGLDDGCADGKLLWLYANMANSAHWEAVSAITQMLVIDGRTYNMGASTIVGVSGETYGIDLSGEDISLPCEYTLYCTPASLGWEMDVALKATVSYRKDGENKTSYEQLIGRAVVDKPGAYLTTLSIYVCDEKITVEGSAQPNETVTIYDNGAAVGTATADRYGDYRAIITLKDANAQYLTTHQLRSVTASGVTSDELLVFHQPGGAQLTSFTMTYNGRTINVGETYTLTTRGLSDIKFTAIIKNPDKLDVLADAFNSKVVIKVYTNDGQIRFVPATEGAGGKFVADMGDLPAPVSGAEVMMLPKTVTNPVTDGGLAVGEETVEYVHDLLNQVLGQYNYENGTAYTGFSEILECSTPSEAAFMQDDSGNVTVTAGTATDRQLADVKAKMDETNASLADSGMTVEGSAVQTQNGYNDNSGVAATVRAMAAQNRTVRGTASFITEQCFFSQLQTLLYDFRKTLDLGAEVSMQSGSFDLNNAAAADGDAFFVLSLSGSGYDISVAYVVSTDSKFYMRSITATFHDSFTGFPAGFAAVTSQDGVFTVQQSLVLTREKPMTPYERAQFEAAQDAMNNCWLAKFINYCRTVDGYGMVYLSLVIGLFQYVICAVGGAVITTWDGMNTIMKSSETCQKRYQELSKFRKDLDEQKQHPCYQAMNPTRRSICEELYKKYDNEEGACSTIQALTGLAVLVCTATSIISAVIAVSGCLLSAAVSLVSGAAGFLIGIYGQLWADNLFTKATDAYQNCWMKTAQFIRITAQEYEGDDCKGEKKKPKDYKPDGINPNSSTPNVHDPSGIIYEGVLENPVEGATATLYYAADGSGNPVMEASYNSASQLKAANDVRSLTPNDPIQITGEDGLYQWFVPEGLWFVTAEKGGLIGDSNGDSAATVSKSVSTGTVMATKLLPVLPPQLDVNIPLVDNAAPYVTDVQYKTDGVYVTFSKYMVDSGNSADSVLTSSNYTLMNGTEPV